MKRARKTTVLKPAPAGEDDTRSRVLGAAFKAFTENGYAGTSTLEIATRAKVSKRDLYALFPSKQAMLLACIRTRSDKLRVPGGLPVAASREALGATLTVYGKSLLTQLFDPAVVAMFRVAISEAERSPEVAAAIDGCRSATVETVRGLVVHAQSSGLLPHGDASRIASRFMALLREDLMMGLLLGVASPPSRARIAANVADAVTVFLDIYRTPTR